MSPLESLLVLQERDLALDRLRHRRVAFPARAARVARAREVVVLEAETAEVRAERDEAVTDERALDGEARATAAKATELDRRLYSGEISSPKELQAMQAEVENLRERQRELEDLELEIMERREPLDADVESREAKLLAMAADVANLDAEIAAGEAEIDAEAAGEQAAREQLVSELPADLVDLYERCRKQAGGVGAARLVGATCQGCHLTIPATEVERIRRAPEATVAHCDNCGAILVAG